YQFDFGLRPSVAYYKSKAKDVEGIGSEDYINYVEVGVTGPRSLSKLIPSGDTKGAHL
ncbi:hypothetical protein C3E80_22160, partial [Cronobacter malonaticus]